MTSKKVKCTTELEFVTEVADDCLKHLTERDKKYLIDNPCAIDYHFSYCLYIRNHYIHNRDFSEVPFWVEPDHLSGEIIRMLFSYLINEYEYGNQFVETLFEDTRFIKLRKEYKMLYDEYPAEIVKEYMNSVVLEPAKTFSEMKNTEYADYDEHYKDFEIWKRNYDRCREHAEKLIRELAETVWNLDNLKQIAEDCGINYEELIPGIEEIQRILFEKREYIPVEVSLLPFKRAIGQKRYFQYRKRLVMLLNDNPRLLECLDNSIFNDRVIAKAVLKYGWALEHLPQYQDDEAMVKYCLSHNGTAIEYAASRFQTDRDWVKYAIEHSEDGTIMYLDCMKPYRKDKELVYMACKVDRWNFAYIDRSYRDDYELAKLCMEQVGDSNSIYEYMSTRLRGLKELALLDLQEDFPNTEKYSAKLRNDNDIAAELFRLHGKDAWAWSPMSKRLKKKYGIEE